MKRTEYWVLCGQEGRYGNPIYRRVWKDGDKYIVKWHGKLVDVTEDIADRRYITG